jgi:hypothetical protein
MNEVWLTVGLSSWWCNLLVVIVCVFYFYFWHMMTSGKTRLHLRGGRECAETNMKWPGFLCNRVNLLHLGVH